MRSAIRLLALLLIFQPGIGWSRDDSLQREIDAVARPAGKDRANMDALATKHVPPGTNLDQAKKFLGERGFRIYRYTGRNVPEGREWWIATKNKNVNVILAEEFRFILESDGTTVLKARGWIFLKGL